MAETVQVKLPPEFTPIVEEIRSVRAANLEPTSNTDIVKDALKAMHKSIKNVAK